MKAAVKIICNLPKVFSKIFCLYATRRPDVVMGFGGYPTVLPIISAFLKRIPRVIHEQNVQVGIANKLLSLFANKVFAVHGAVGFWSTSSLEYIGNPVRAKFNQIPEWRYPDSKSEFCILVVGGSQGARSLNDAILANADFFKTLPITLIHQTGSLDFERVRGFYSNIGFKQATTIEFIDDLPAAYAKAQLIIARAGAMTVAEISAAGRPAIFVPLVIAGGHQAKNSAHLVKAGAAKQIDQGEGLAEQLAAQVKLLIENPRELEAMAKKAVEISRIGNTTSAERIAQELIKIGSR